MRKSIILILCSLFLFKSSLLAQNKVVLKLDDIEANNNTSRALPVMDYLLQREIKASYGVIAKRLDETALNVLGKYINATNAKGEKLIEIWHHGFDHTNNNPPAKNQEFKGTDYAFQKQHFEDADQRVKKYLGVQMHSFGSPYNAVDSNTLKVIAENPNYKTVMFFWESPSKEKQIRRLNNRINLEKETGKPDFESFVIDYNKHPEYQKSNIVLQGHPNQWDAAKFEQFKLIIDFLISKKSEFVLASEIK